jgi:hypothetical protein
MADLGQARDEREVKKTTHCPASLLETNRP